MTALLAVGGCEADFENESVQIVELEASKGDDDNVCDLIDEEGVSFSVNVIDAFGKKYSISDLIFENGERFEDFFSVIENERLPFFINEEDAKIEIVFIQYVQKQGGQIKRDLTRDLQEKNYVNSYMRAPTAEEFGNESLVLRYCNSSQRCEKFPERPVFDTYKGFWQKDANNKISRTFCFINTTSIDGRIEEAALRRHLIASRKFHYADCFFQSMGVRGRVRDLSELSDYDYLSAAYLGKFKELSLQSYTNRIESIENECERG